MGIIYPMKKILRCSLFLLSIPQFLNAQSADSLTQKDNIKLSRTTLSAGYVSLSHANNNDDFSSVFLNVHRRISEFDQYTKPFKLGFFFEPGVNLLIPIGREYSLPMPYFKGGPEMKVNNNLYAGASLGFILILYGKFLPLPFNGLNIFYLTNISNKIFVEFEGGVHTVLPFAPDLLFYFTAGISIR